MSPSNNSETAPESEKIDAAIKALQQALDLQTKQHDLQKAQATSQLEIIKSQLDPVTQIIPKG